MLKMTDVYRKDGGDSHVWLSRKSMGKVLTILMSFSACTSSRHMWGAYMGPRLRSLLSLSLGLLVSVPLRGTTSSRCSYPIDEI